MRVSGILLQIVQVYSVEYTIIAESKQLTRDGELKNVVLFNDTMPAPKISAKVGEELIVNLINKSNEPTSIHWHGLDQQNSYKMDGVPYLTQLPVKPGETFTYKMNIGEQPGTYWYHSHYHNQSATAFGPLIVEENNWKEVVKFEPKYQYDEEKIIMMSDYYNKTKPIITESIEAQAGKTYRLRLIGATIMELNRFILPGYKLTVIEMDGFLTKPTEVDSILVHSGERVSVLAKLKDTPTLEYTMSKIKFNKTTVTEAASNKLTQEEKDGIFPELSPWYQFKYPKGNGHYFPLPKLSVSEAPGPKSIFRRVYKPDQDKYVYQINKGTDGSIPKINQDDFFNVTVGFRLKFFELEGGKHSHKWLVNEREYDESKETSMQKGFIDLKKGKYTRLIVEMTASKNGICEPHPWHLHGHPFYIIGKGSGKYDKDNVKYDTQSKNPIMKDTFTFMSDNNYAGVLSTPDKPCGWYELMFKADNPGNWSFHCHIIPHMPMGMVTSFNYQ